MSRFQPTSRSFVALVVSLLAVGLWQVGEGSWIYAKAGLAQLLLRRAWSRTLEGEGAVKPWPWADTWPVARLTVPARRIDLIVLNGAYGRSLAFGPGYLESSALPGSTGTTILTGHRDTHFAFLELIQTGERFMLQSRGGRTRSYRVIDRRVIDSRTGRIRLNREQPSLVLVTCYPFRVPIPGGPLRWIVTAEAEDHA